MGTKRTPEQEEFVQMVVRKANSQDEQAKPHEPIVQDTEEIEKMTKRLTDKHADQK